MSNELTPYCKASHLLLTDMW